MDDALTLAQARQGYFAEHRLGDGGYAAASVRVRFGPLVVDLPNTTARRKAVPLHDLHHALTGYGSDWRGEAEVSAWEVAGGCGRYPAAWVLVVSAFGLAVLAYPCAALRAFVRGRGRGNLFTDYPHGETPELLATSRSEAQARYGLDRPPRRAGFVDLVAFSAWAVVAIPLVTVFAAALLLLAVAQAPRRLVGRED
jgi:hypothetical protein